jgi:hypothetical protein
MLKTGYDDLSWYQAHLDQIKEKYDKQFVAVRNRKIVVSSPNMDLLVKDLKRKNISRSQVLISYVSKVRQILY